MSLSVSLSFIFSDLLMMKNTKTVAVPINLTDTKTIEAIAYNIAAMAQIQPSMSEPADVSLSLPSSDLLLMDTKTAAVSTVLTDAKTIEAIAYNIATMAQIQPSMSEPADVSLPLPSSDLLLMDTKTTAQIQPSSMSEFADGADPATKTAAVPRVVAKTQIQPSSMSEFADGADDHPSAARRPAPSSPLVRGRVRRRCIDSRPAATLPLRGVVSCARSSSPSPRTDVPGCRRAASHGSGRHVRARSSSTAGFFLAYFVYRHRASSRNLHGLRRRWFRRLHLRPRPVRLRCQRHRLVLDKSTPTTADGFGPSSPLCVSQPLWSLVS
jgi:hypothetical protein